MGNFRSCYHLIQALGYNQAEAFIPSSSGGTELKWDSIWHLNIPPKVRMFVWRACANILPMKVALFRRHVAANPFCDRCGKEVESLAHTLFVCRDSEQIWSSDPFNLPSFPTQTSMWEIMAVLRRLLSPELFLDAVVICWNIWEVRNTELHGSLEELPGNIATWAREYRKLYEEAQLGNGMKSDNTLESQCKPPEPGVIKINVDVGLPAGLDSFRIGLVAGDSAGQVLWWRVKQITGRPNPVDGEAMAVYHGVFLAKDKSWPRVII